ncbi:MAG: amidase family protein, partial [Ancalomicrobiaceae bacterium]|nr:amidase family protein [Ancalomicrobiaceae bacterium]
MAQPLHYWSIVELGAAYRARKVSPVEVVEAMLARIAELDPGLHAYLLVTADAARAEAKTAEAEIASGRYRGPMHGIPIGYKDLNFSKGVKTTFGMRVHKD